MRLTVRLTWLLLALIPGTAQALSLEFPGLTSPLAQDQSAAESVFLPTAPFQDGQVEGVTAEGQTRRQSWRIGSGGLTTLQLLAPLREQMEFEGYEILYECEAALCGGFDFRYRLQTFPEPEMHVALGDYRYLAAQKIVDGAPEYASLIVSRSGNAGFVQLTQVGASAKPARVTASTKAPAAADLPRGPVAEQLETLGHATLDDLVFKVGKSELGDEAFGSLSELAAYLRALPSRQVTLVGHTDSEGSLEGNMALSKRRAGAVLQRLIEVHGVNPDQIAADGIGYLSPVASNLTPEGRAQNRRVEAILTSTN